MLAGAIEVVGALSAAVAAVAGALGALAAWRSASASAATSKDALEALALGIRPKLTGNYAHLQEGGRPPRVGFMIRNTSRFDARDVDVDVLRRDGQTVRSHCELIRANESPGDPPSSEWFVAEVGTVGVHTNADEFLHTVTLTYSDGREIARWQKRYEWTETHGDGVVTRGYNGLEPERRVR